MKPLQSLCTRLLLLASLGIAATGCGPLDAPDAAPDPDSVEGTPGAVSASVCGAGYKLVGNLPLERVTTGSVPNPSAGELEVFYNAAEGRNCLAVQALGSLYGVKKHMFVRVCAKPFTQTNCSSAENYDSGDYKYYAGPVYITAPHQCIYYSGGIYGATPATTYALTGKGFCG